MSEKASAGRLSEHQLRALVNGVPALVFAVDRAADVVAVEGETAAALGRPPKEVLGWAVAEVFAGSPDVIRGIDAALAGTSTDGSAELQGRTFSMRYVPVRDPAGQVTGAVGLALDVTQRREAENALREQGELAEALVDAQSDLGDLVVVTEEGRTIFVNEAACRITGYSDSELLALPSFYRLGLSAGEQRVQQVRAGRNPGDVIRFELPIRSRAGALVELDMAEVEVSAGSKRWVVAIGRDVTELRQAERERQALVSRLLSAEETTRQKIAHDIHDDSIQTLFAALLRLQVLRAQLQDPKSIETLDELSATLDRSVESLRHLLFELRPVVLDSDGLAATLRLNLEELKKRGGIEGHVVDRCERQPDAGARTILYRIAQEALANIRKHSKARRVEVELENRDGGVLLRIRDDGRGFAAGERPRSRPGHLGLDAMRERAEMAQGTLAIHSAEGAGTVIEVWLPQTTGQQTAA